MIYFGEVVTKFLSWQVHSSFNISFWKDSWNGCPPLCLTISLIEVMGVSSLVWGDFLVYYVDCVDIVSHKVFWKDHFSLPIGRNLARKLVDIRRRTKLQPCEIVEKKMIMHFLTK